MFVNFKENYIGSRQFYRGVFAIAAPIIVQNIITNLVNMLDNIMVGQVGTEPMSGVAIVNQLIFVFNLGVFGFTSGIGILTTQYFGKKDDRGVANTFRSKFLFGAVYLCAALVVFRLLGDKLIWAYLHDGEVGLDLQSTFLYGHDYLQVILWGLPFFLVSQIYSTTLRDTKETRLPMIAGISAVFVNLIFNYLLIYGKLGLPRLGIIGAAIATVMSRIVECFICIIWTHTHGDKARFAKGAFKSFKTPKGFTGKLLALAIPAFINEILWSFGQTMLNQSMSLRGVEIVSAINISNTVNVLSKSCFLAIGVSLAILVGNALGAGDAELAIDTDRKVMFISFATSAAIGILVLCFAGFVPSLYNTEESVKAMATTFIRITAAMMPMQALINACYHTVKCGGRAIITFLYDAGYTWIICVPLAYCLAHFTGMPIVPMYVCIFGVDIIKLTAGLILVNKKIWVRNLVRNEEEV